MRMSSRACWPRGRGAPPPPSPSPPSHRIQHVGNIHHNKCQFDLSIIMTYQHHKGQFDLPASQGSVWPTSTTRVSLTYQHHKDQFDLPASQRKTSVIFNYVYARGTSIRSVSLAYASTHKRPIDLPASQESVWPSSIKRVSLTYPYNKRKFGLPA